MKIAIIGAGVSGLVLARELAQSSDIYIFEKSRGVGGRMSTRYDDPYYFDHGAQYFTARSRRFKKYLQPFVKSGCVAKWEPKVTTLKKDKRKYSRIWFEPHYVGVPHMNSLCRSLAENLNVQFETKVKKIIKDSNGWTLESEHGQNLGVFDWVVSTAPAQQTSELFPHTFREYQQLESIKMSACWTLMIILNQAPSFSWQAAVVKESPLGWIALNSSKPGRNLSAPCMVVHSTNTWAEKNLALDPKTAQKLLTNELFELTGLSPESVKKVSTHRWLYANVEDSGTKDYFIDTEKRLAVCTDGCIGGRVESAFQSATRLANHFKRLKSL